MDALLAPLDGAQACGDDLSFSAEFDAIAEMRREDDPTLDQGEWVTSLKSADWPGVIRQCEALLAQRTKDLRVACWRTEALALTRGYPGLNDGLRLVGALCRQFGPDLHPRIDDGDAEERAGALRWLLARVKDLSDRLPVRHDAAGRALTLADLSTAPPTDAAGTAALAEQVLGLTQAVEALRELQQIVDAQLGAEGPGFTAARDALEGVAHTAQRLVRPSAPSAASGPRAEVRSAAGEAAVAGALGAHGALGTIAEGPIASREQALAMLREVATFFRQTEPHSPVAYLADKAAHWGTLPLHEWLRQVMKDSGTLAHLEELLGVEPAPASDAG